MPFTKKIFKKELDKFLRIRLTTEELAQEYIRNFLNGAKVVISPDEEDEIIAKAKQQDGSYSKYEIWRRMIYFLEKQKSGAQKRIFKMMGVNSMTEMKELLEQIDEEEKGKAIGDMWKQAEWYRDNVLEKSVLLEGYLDDEKDMVKAMEKDVTILRERYKHSEPKLYEIARDWMNFANAVYDMKFAREMLDVDMSKEAYDNFDERTKEARVIIPEITKRIEKELGEDANIKPIRLRIENKGKAANEVLDNAVKKEAKSKKTKK
jgi:hypothetical protein